MLYKITKNMQESHPKFLWGGCMENLVAKMSNMQGLSTYKNQEEYPKRDAFPNFQLLAKRFCGGKERLGE
jgi:hypothetical protein